MGTRFNYAPNEPWKNFSQIIEIDTSALTSVTADAQQAARVFTLDGRPAADPNQPGSITLHRLPDGTSHKQVIR